MANQYYSTIGVRSMPTAFDRAGESHLIVFPASSYNRGLLTSSYSRHAPRTNAPSQPGGDGKLVKVRDQVNVEIAAAHMETHDPESYNRGMLTSSYAGESPAVMPSTAAYREHVLNESLNVAEPENDSDVLHIPDGFKDRVKALKAKGYSDTFIKDFLSRLQFRSRSRLTKTQSDLFDELVKHHVSPTPPLDLRSKQPTPPAQPPSQQLQPILGYPQAPSQGYLGSLGKWASPSPTPSQRQPDESKHDRVEHKDEKDNKDDEENWPEWIGGGEIRPYISYTPQGRIHIPESLVNGMWKIFLRVNGLDPSAKKIGTLTKNNFIRYSTQEKQYHNTKEILRRVAAGDYAINTKTWIAYPEDK